MKKQIKRIYFSKVIAIFILSGYLVSCDKGEVPSITTSEIILIKGTSATSGGTVTNEGSGTITSRGVCWSTSINPTIKGNKTSDGAGAGSFSSDITGLIGLTTYFVRAYATNSIGTGYGMTMSFTTTGVTDIDGNFYETVQIGTQDWMAENLKTTEFNDGSEIPNVTDDTEWSDLSTAAFCWYQNDEVSYKNKYGALYNWYTVQNGKLCPQGWRVPTDEEWTTLENYLSENGFNFDGSIGFNGYAKALASDSGWNPSETIGAPGNTDFPQKRNATGFSALPGGVRDANQRLFGAAGNYGIWWTSSEVNSATAWDRGVDYSLSTLGRVNVNKATGFSVRCLKE
jgi:uncharacterized protein (TIGR02145 family)